MATLGVYTPIGIWYRDLPAAVKMSQRMSSVLTQVLTHTDCAYDAVVWIMLSAQCLWMGMSCLGGLQDVFAQCAIVWW